MPPTARSVLCADIGTGSLKMALIDRGPDGALAPRAFERVPYQHGVGIPALEALFYRTARALLAGAASPPQALVVSAGGPCLIPVDARGEPGAALWWFSGAERGLSLASFFIPYMLFHKQHAPRAYAACRTYFSCQEYICWRLGARPVTVLPTPAYRPYYWEEVELEKAGIAPEKLNPFVAMGEACGEVSADAARRTGLPAGLPLIPAGPDFIMALLGAGTVRPGQACDRAGSTEGINMCVEAAALPRLRDSGLRLLPHAAEGYWNASALIPESGSLFERYRRERGLEAYGYAPLLAALLPEWGGPEDGAGDTAAAGADIRAVPAAVIEEGRGLLERLARAARAAADKLRANGLVIDEMVMSGGQAKNARWNRFKAARLECRLIVPPIPDTELAGNAALGAAALR